MQFKGTSRPPNISLQRTSSRRLAAAELGSFGGTARARLFFSASLIASVIILGCRKEGHWGTVEFRSRIGQLELSNDCEKASNLVQAENARQDPRWYELLVELRLDCQAKTRERRYGEESLDLVNAGIQRFPGSSRLVFLKGFVNGRLGEAGVERRYYEDALKLANENIAADRGGLRTADDREVAENAAKNLGATWKPAR